MSGETNPYQSPVMLPEDDPVAAAEEAAARGFGRAGFAVLLVICCLASAGIMHLLGSSPFTSFVCHIPFALATIPRLRNIGRRPAAALLMFIPILNLCTLVFCMILPPAYETNRKYDLTAKILLGSILFLLVAWIGYAVYLFAGLTRH